MQLIVNEALENGLALYEKRHPRGEGPDPGRGRGIAQRGRGDPGRVGGRQIFKDRQTHYYDYNRVTGSLAATRLGVEAVSYTLRRSTRA